MNVFKNSTLALVCRELAVNALFVGAVAVAALIVG